MLDGRALRFHLQALLVARGHLLDRDPAAIPSIRRLATAVGSLAGATGSLKQAVNRLGASQDFELHLRVDDLLGEIRRTAGIAKGSGAVLLIDDDPAIRSMMRMIVQPYAREVHTFASLAEAREALGSQRPSAVVLDLKLPDGDGRELLLELQADRTLESVPVLVLSSDTSPLVRAECLALGAREVHAKPIDPVELTQAISVVLGFEDRTQLTSTGDLITGLLGPADMEAEAIRLRDRFLISGETWSVLAVRGAHQRDLVDVSDAVRAALGPGVVACRDGASVLVLLERDMAGAQALASELSATLGTGASAGGTEAANSEWEEMRRTAKRMLLLASQAGESLVVPAISTSRNLPRVVVVDDDPSVAPMVQGALGSGHEVLPLTDGDRLFEVLDTQRPTAVVLDIGLPGRSGLELLRELRANPRFSTIPVVMLTSYAKPRQVEEGFVAGADDYLTKPFDPVVLRVRLLHALARRR